MADNNGKGKAVATKTKTPSGKGLTQKIGSLSLDGKRNVSFSGRTNQTVLSDDSDSEGFLEEKSQVPLKVSEKTPPVKSSTKKRTLDKSAGASSDSPKYKGDSGKGGSTKGGGKGGIFSSGKGGGKESFLYSGKNGGKASHSKAVPPKASLAKAELKLEIDLPEHGNARVLMDCEAIDILQGIEGKLKVLLEDPEIKIPDAFSKSLEYYKMNCHYTSSKHARQVLDTLESSGVTPGEACMIGNICPENVDEVYSLIPSLKANRSKTEEPIRNVLAELAKLKKPE